MPRHKTPAQMEHDRAKQASAMQDWCGGGVKKPKSRRIRPPSTAARARATQETLEMIEAQDWSRAKPEHFVALYAHLHERVYGVFPAEMSGAEGTLARASARRMLEKEFGGDGNEMSDFMRWVWKREAADEKRRKEGTKDNNFRIGWRYQFSPKLMTDYRLALARLRPQPKADRV